MRKGKILFLVTAGLIATLILAGCAPAAPTPKTQTFDIYMWEKKAVAEGPLVELIPPTETSADLLTEFYHWEPQVLVAFKGDTVVLNVSNPRGTIHSFGIPAFGVDTGPLAPRGGKATISFVADKAGSFNYLCTLPWDPTTDPEECHPDHKYMTGVLLVLDR